MTRGVIVDTGPLVAFLNKRDTWHEWAVGQLAAIEPPLETCEAVVSEAVFLLRVDPRGSDALLELVERNLVVCSFHLNDALEHVRRLMKRYQDVPMSLADACLVRMTEERRASRVLTLDSDFRRYRRLGRQVIPLIAPK
jgi:predicted nucleic acid-binding protein